MITVREDIAKLQETISGEGTGIAAQIDALDARITALEEAVEALTPAETTQSET